MRDSAEIWQDSDPGNEGIELITITFTYELVQNLTHSTPRDSI